MSKEEAIASACRDHNYSWPKELWTGIMFYYGHRITITEFNKHCILFR